MPRHLRIRILSRERPSDTSLVRIAAALPSVDLGHQCGAVWQAPIQALAIKDADFDFSHVQPTGVFRRVVKDNATQKRLIGQLGLTGEISPVRHPAKRRRLRTVLQEVMYRAAQFIAKARKLILDFGALAHPVVPVFVHVQGRLLAARSP